MKLLLDEMYSFEIARQLRQLGHDVISVKERQDLLGAADAALIALMVVEGRVIVTNNARDFMFLCGQLAAAGSDHGGLILTSDHSLPRSRATIDRWVELLDVLLREAPPDSISRNVIRWLP